MEDVLLLFDENHPCWTKDMVDLTGEDSGALDALFRRGFLDKEEEVYFLSREGVDSFRKSAEGLFLPLHPGVSEKSTDRRRKANQSLLRLLLDKRHLQRWGLKEYRAPFRFELPDLKEEKIFALDGETLTWLYPKHPVFAAMERDFPITGMAARKTAPPSPELLAAWMDKNAPRRRVMEADLLYKSRYDFQAYAGFPPLPCDPCGLLNADRFMFFFASPPEPENRNVFLTILGEFQMFLTMLRRLVLPGYVDMDSLDQEPGNWLLFTYEKESGASRCAELLASFGKDLAGPASPLNVWSLSLEALWGRGETAETIYDLLPFVSHPIFRP